MEHPSVPHTPPLLPSLLSPLVSGTLTPKTHGVPKNPWSHDVSPKLCRRHRPTTLAVHPPFIKHPSPTSTSTLPPVLLHPPYISRVWANHGSKQSCKKKQYVTAHCLPACSGRQKSSLAGWACRNTRADRSLTTNHPARSPSYFRALSNWAAARVRFLTCGGDCVVSEGGTAPAAEHPFFEAGFLRRWREENRYGGIRTNHPTTVPPTQLCNNRYVPPSPRPKKSTSHPQPRPPAQPHAEGDRRR